MASNSSLTEPTMTQCNGPSMVHAASRRKYMVDTKKPVKLEHFNILERHDYERNRVNLSYVTPLDITCSWIAFNYKNDLSYFMEKNMFILPTYKLQVHDIFLIWCTVLKFCIEHRAKDFRLKRISGGIVTVPKPSYIHSFERQFSLRPQGSSVPFIFEKVG